MRVRIVETIRKRRQFFINGFIILLVNLGLAHAQIERWVYRTCGFGTGVDYGEAIIYGTDGNIYATGTMYGENTDQDFVIISLTLLGNERWLYTYNGPGNNWDYGLSLTYGLDGNIYACGCSYDSSGDFTVISLTPLANERWVYRFNGSGNFNDFANSIAYGLDGKIYVAGRSVGSGTSYDLTIICLDTAGNEQWRYLYNGTGNSNDIASSIVYGLDGNIYAAGSTTNSGTGIDFTIISLTTSGDERWLYTFNGPENGTEGAAAIAYGLDGNIYAAGQCFNSGTGGADYFTVISLTSSGNERWVYRYDNPQGNYYDGASSLVYALDGNIYAAGESYGSGSSRDITVISFTPSGNERWVYQYNGPGNFWDWANSIVYGIDHYIYVAGRSYGLGTGFDFTVIKLDTLGNGHWIYRYDGPANDQDEAYSITYGTDSDLYVAGYSEGISTYFDFTVISLDPTTGINEKQTTLPLFVAYFPLFQNKIILKFNQYLQSPLEISLYNVYGAQVLEKVVSGNISNTLILEDKKFTELTPGVYFLTVSSGYRNFGKVKLIKI